VCFRVALSDETSGLSSVCAFLDISQAFDKVWHAGLLCKLRQALPLNYFLLLKSYSYNRHFRVKVGNDYSELKSIHAGIPQGSVLGPLLYLLYTADLPTSPRTFVANFADDTAILTKDSQRLPRTFFKRTY
jgi:retron-type reverse transcriptase